MKILSPKEYILTNSNISDSSYPTWDNATSFNIGDNVYVEENHGEYEALTTNTDKYPLKNPTDWKFLGTANKYAMFDQYINTVSQNENTIELEIYAYSSGGLFLGNLNANEITIEVVYNDSIIESETINMLREPLDWEEYFYGDWIEEFKTNLFYERKTLTNDITYCIKISNGADIAKCGICVVGGLSDIGLSLYGVNLSALDYSTVQIDKDSGVTFLEQGNYAKSMKLDVSTRTSGLDTVYKKLVELRGKPNVFVGGGDFGSLNVFGYIKKFDTIISNPTITKISLDLSGLI